MMTFLQAAEAVATSEETRMGLWKLFSMGGWLMWPLLALGGVTIFIFVERFMAIRKASVLDMNFMNRIREKLVFQMEANSIAFMDILNQPVQK